MNVKLIRKKKDKGTLGVLKVNNVEICQTLELPWVDEDGNLISDKLKSCINEGIFLCKRIVSPHFGEVFEVTDVPGRTHILIHVANFLKELLGCIAVGMISGEEDGQYRLYKSREAFNSFMKLMEGVDEFTLEIISE